MPSQVSRVVTDNSIFVCDLRANNDPDFFLCSATVQAGRNQNGHAFDWNSRGVKTREQRRQRDRVRRGACNIAYRDRSSSFGRGQRGERLAAYGAIECLGQRRVNITKRSSSMTEQHPAVVAIGD